MIMSMSLLWYKGTKCLPCKQQYLGAKVQRSQVRLNRYITAQRCQEHLAPLCSNDFSDLKSVAWSFLSNRSINTTGESVSWLQPAGNRPKIGLQAGPAFGGGMGRIYPPRPLKVSPHPLENIPPFTNYSCIFKVNKVKIALTPAPGHEFCSRWKIAPPPPAPRPPPGSEFCLRWN